MAPIDENCHPNTNLSAYMAEVDCLHCLSVAGIPLNHRPQVQRSTSTATAAIEQYDHLSNMGIQKIAFYGTSLGSGVAAQLASHRQPDLLILDAPFNSVSDMAKRQVPFLPTSILLKDTWRSDEALRGLNMPLIWIHGTADGVIPVSQGEKLYTAYTGPKTSLVISGANHINTWLNGGSKVVLEALNKL